MSLNLVSQQVAARQASIIELDQPVEVAQLPTPALVLNRSGFERNLKTMADFVASHNKGFRPHGKTHKCPTIAKKQLEYGAVGICVAKVSEALAMVSAGVNNLLITSPLTTPSKAEVLAKLCEQSAELKVVVDSEIGLDVIRKQLANTSRLGIVIDFDVSMGRTGTRDDKVVLRLIDKISADARLSLVGIQHYAGHLMHIDEYTSRRERSLELWSKVSERVEKLESHGIQFDVITGCGTGTYDIDVDVEKITDLQVGSYIFMDEEYRQIGSAKSDRFTDFEVSLTMACTAISQPMGNAITVDGGYKAFASDTVPPACDELPGAKFRFAGDEHGVIIKKEGEQALKLGDVVQLVTPHCDPTVNLHDFYWVQDEDQMIRECWPITGRGCTW